MADLTSEELDARARMKMAERGFVADPKDPQFAGEYKNALLEVMSEERAREVAAVERHFLARHGGVPLPRVPLWRRLLRRPLPAAELELWMRNLPLRHHYAHHMAIERDHLPDDLSSDARAPELQKYMVLHPVLLNGVQYAPEVTLGSLRWGELLTGLPLTIAWLAPDDPNTKDLVSAGFIAQWLR